MKTQPKHIIWWNTLGDRKRDELAMDYYGSDLIMDDEIEKIYTEEHRYYIEFDGKRKYLSVFPLGEEHLNQTHKTIPEALDYMINECHIKEITVKN